ncbi:MAG: patatin family protein [Prevotella sp.]|nr:patatin family protein [Prevotella sp.]
MKTGLVLEGGAMRGLFSAGVIDVMMEHGVEVDGIIGVSAGAAFGCNYKSRQAGRAIRYNMRFCKDKRYAGLHSLITTGDLFNAEFAYHVVPTEYDVFDGKTFEENKTEFVVVCTDIEKGLPVYHRIDRFDYDALEWIRASASMPMVSNVVELEGMKLLDGGVTDSIPLRESERRGYKRNIVILTQPEGYRKEKLKLMPLAKLWLRRYPELVKAMAERHIMYNNQLDYVAEREKEGTAIVVRPDEKLPIGHTSHNADEMHRVYMIGRRKGEELCKLKL